MTPGDTLYTERLILRPFRPEDIDDVYAYAWRPGWGRYLASFPEPYTYKDAEKFVGRSILRDSTQDFVFAIELDQRVIGEIHLRVEIPHGAAKLGFGINRRYWGRGIATEAAMAIVEWGFQVVGLNRIYARIDPRNLAGIRILETLGMQKEGLLRSHRYHHEEQADEAFYGILSTEWKEGEHQ